MPPSNNPKQRKRKIWSCLECRRRKLHCDRALPVCTRCSKLGNSSQCHYMEKISSSTQPVGTEHGVDEGFDITPPASSLGGQITNLHVAKQPQFLSSHAPTSIPNRTEASALPVTGKDIMQMYPDWTASAARKQSVALGATPSAHNPSDRQIELPAIYMAANTEDAPFTNPCVESSSYASLVDHIPGLIPLGREAFEKFAILDRIRREIHRQETKNLEEPTSKMDDDLRVLLPPKIEMDELVASYFENFADIYAVVHEKEFRRQYIELWSSTSEMGKGQNPRFIVLVLLMAASALCLQSLSIASSDIAGKPSHRDRVTSITAHCRRWLNAHPDRRHHPCQSNPPLDSQARFLLLFVQELNARRHKRTYANAGKLVREFMCTGLHRTHTGELSSKQQGYHGMQWRLWRAAAEFELQAAFEQGLPPLMYSEKIEYRTPTVGTASEPSGETAASTAGTYCNESGGQGVPVSSSFLDKVNSSFTIRRRLCLYLNTNDGPLTFSAAKQLTEELESHLKPDDCRTLAEALANLTIRQYLLALHERQLRHATSPFERRMYCAALVFHAIIVIETHDRFKREGSSVLELLSAQQIRAAFVIAEVCLTMTASAEERLMNRFLIAEMDAMNMAIAMAKRKVTRYSGDQRQLFLLMSSRVLIQSKGLEPKMRDMLLQKMVDEYAAVFKGLLVLPELRDNGEHLGDINTITMAEQQQPLDQQDVDLLNDFVLMDDLGDWGFNMCWTDGT